MTEEVCVCVGYPNPNTNLAGEWVGEVDFGLFDTTVGLTLAVVVEDVDVAE